MIDSEILLIVMVKLNLTCARGRDLSRNRPKDMAIHLNGRGRIGGNAVIFTELSKEMGILVQKRVLWLVFSCVS